MVKSINKFCALVLLLVLAAALFFPAPASAQTYSFSLSTYEVEAYLEKDGSLTLRYYMVFENDTFADPIDFVDLGLPYAKYSLKNISGTVDGQTISKIGSSAYVHGAELALQDLAIKPGQSGTVIATVTGITGVLFPYDQGDRQDYANFRFSPNTFGAEFDQSTATKYRLTIVLPPGVGVNDGVYFRPSGWPGSDTPEASTTQDGRVYYSWYSEKANVHSNYNFGVAFPASVVPASAISSKDKYTQQEQKPSSGSGGFSIDPGAVFCCGGSLIFIAFIVLSIVKGSKDQAKRKMAYMPPKISIEGQGIKRGLTAVEAGILMEEPLDKILTMIMFGLLKKEAITITQKEPLTIKASEPLPEGLYDYEKGFIQAFLKDSLPDRKRALQTTIIDLVNSVTAKMKGFSKAETVAYYKDIIARAWKAVTESQTPEIKSAQYDHTLEWTMLDKNFNTKTEETFSGGPVIMPMWWPRYNPGWQPSPQTSGGGLSLPASSGTGTSSGGSRPSLSLPNIPGSDFAASMIHGASGLAAGVIGDLTGFTSAVTSKTNPIPTVSVSSGSGGFRGGGGGGHSCACACACAGCACACAGGGR